MNEDFMRQFQKMPDSILLEKIHVRLAGKERKHRIKQYFTHSVMTLIFVFGIVLIFSSAVRVAALQTVEHVQVLICKKFKTPCTGDGVLTPEQGLYVPLEYLSLDEAKVRFIPPVILPTYIPQGFERRIDVEFFEIPDQPALVVTWDRKDNYKRIKLLVSHHSVALADYARTLGKGAITETTLMGKPAIIVRGVWNIGVRENDFVTTAVMWRYDENTVYALISVDLAVPVDELVKMAESIP